MNVNDTRFHVYTKDRKTFEPLGFNAHSPEGRDAVLDGPIQITKGVFLDEETLPIFVEMISERINGNGIVIADTTNNSVDPFTFYCYDLGDGIKSGYMPSDKIMMFYEAPIEDIREWIKYGGFVLSEKEKALLDAVGLPDLKKSVKSEDETMNLEDTFPEEYDYLLETLSSYEIENAAKTARQLLYEYLGGEVSFLGPGQMYIPMLDDAEFEKFKNFALRDISKKYKRK